MPGSYSFSPLSQLLGTSIVDRTGLMVGFIREFLVDQQNGRIAYVQLCLGHDYEHPERIVTVPWSSICSTPGMHSGWQLRVGKTALAALFSPGHH